jgi:hypothetical protein
MQIRKKGGWNLIFFLLFWNYWANPNQTLLKWSSGGPLSKLCPSASSCIQDGQNCSILSQKMPKFELYKHNDEQKTCITGFLWTLNFCLFWPIMQIRKRGMRLKKNLLLWNYCANLNQTLLKWSLGRPLSKWYPSALSCIQDGRHY